jgi:hypothetical protein
MITPDEELKEAMNDPTKTTKNCGNCGALEPIVDNHEWPYCHTNDINIFDIDLLRCNEWEGKK